MPVLVPLALGLMSLVGTPPGPRAAPPTRDVQLIGFGLVVGLDGTGSRSPFTRQVVEDMTVRIFGPAPGRMRRIADRQLNDRPGPCRRPRDESAEGILGPMNCSAVLVTAVLPAATEKGGKVHLSVSSMDDATSLRGGVLLLTPLKGADGEVYAGGQGPLAVRPSDGGLVRTATIRNGGLVEVAVGVNRSVFTPPPGRGMKEDPR